MAVAHPLQLLAQGASGGQRWWRLLLSACVEFVVGCSRPGWWPALAGLWGMTPVCGALAAGLFMGLTIVPDLLHLCWSVSLWLAPLAVGPAPPLCRLTRSFVRTRAPPLVGSLCAD